MVMSVLEKIYVSLRGGSISKFFENPKKEIAGIFFSKLQKFQAHTHIFSQVQVLCKVQVP
jgi:hypothetical protein